MTYIPSQKILERYADVLVNFALGGGKGISKGDVVRITAHESAKPLFREVYRAVLKAGGHALLNYLPDDDSVGADYNLSRDFFTLAKPEQLDFYPKKQLEGLVAQVDHSLMLISEVDKQALAGIDAKKIMRRGMAMLPYKKLIDAKEHAGHYTWTLALYGTAAMAAEAGLTEEEYWQQIIRGCYLDVSNPKAKWKETYRKLEHYRKKFNALSPQIDRLHIEGDDADLWIKLGDKRAWMCGSGRNIPSFEIFTSPDCRGTEGWIRFNQPLYRYGNKIEGVELEFRAGKVVRSKARTNETLLKQMIATPGADMVGEFSLTDARFSKITKFMAETLYDENIGGPDGNTHIALGAAYKECYAGDVSTLSPSQAKKLGYNESSVHTDIISTTKRTVTAHLKNGTQHIIYKKGHYVL